MDFADEGTLLVGLILVLGLAYIEVIFWSKKSGAAKGGGGILGGMGGGAEGSGRADGTGTNAVADMGMD